MKLQAYPGALLAAVLLVLGPCSAHGQESDDCVQFYCTAYAAAGGGQISGYVEYYDDNQDWYLGVNAYARDPSGVLHGCGLCSGEGYDDVTANVTYTPGVNGPWSVEGYPWYDLEGQEIPDGEIFYDAYVLQMPSGEDPEFSSYVDAGAIFAVMLLPAYYDFDGPPVSESVSAPEDDCYARYGKSQVTTVNTGGPWSTQGNIYGDKISSSDGWISDYMSATSPSGVCGWSVFQTMSYAGSPYASWWDGQTVEFGTQWITYRGSANVTVY